MVVWGWPFREATKSVHDVLQCACELVESAERFSLGDSPITIGVGLNAGAMFIGNVESGDKRQFTVLGDVVNMAARYESASREVGAPIVMGQAFFERLDAEFREGIAIHDHHPMKGVEPQTLYAMPAVIASTVARKK